MLGECFGLSFSIVCSMLPLRLKDLPLTLPLDDFLPAADPIGGDDRLGDAEYYRYYFPPGEPNRANMKTSAESRTSA